MKIFSTFKSKKTAVGDGYYENRNLKSSLSFLNNCVPSLLVLIEKVILSFLEYFSCQPTDFRD
jgi:hypothetical protein